MFQVVRPSIRISLFALASLVASALLAQKPAEDDPNRVSPARLAAWHAMTTERCHPAGSKADRALAKKMADEFRRMGLEVELQKIHPWLSRPVSASLTILGEESSPLSLTERGVDSFSTKAEHSIGFNAYSASGTVTAEVVYANYARKEDFERLRELGIDCRGKIVIARYGGNYRGYKAYFAELAGAAGLVIFTDPHDSGWRRGLTWPEGGWANGSSIQRGSIKTGNYYGDPLTPGVVATENAERIAVEDFPFPKIPVQPIGWNAARRILKKMRGTSVPQSWQGALPFRYRLEGGEELRLKLSVQQERKLRKTYNVVAKLAGKTRPEEMVIFGSHHDAWTFGAGDPCAGVMVVLEAARVFAEAAKTGWRPRRSLVFALWGAEEDGIIGSVEWIEKHSQALELGAVAYVNLDGAAMGPRVWASASPSLQPVLAESASAVLDTTKRRRILEGWLKRGAFESAPEIPRMGNLGGGSDHVGFLARVGVAAAGIGAGGSAGSSYHTAYDNLDWYRSVVGDDYQSARMVTEWVEALGRRLADDLILPLSPGRMGAETRRHLDFVSTEGMNAGLWKKAPPGRVAAPLARIEAAALHLEARWQTLQLRLQAESTQSMDDEKAERINRHLIRCDRAWLDGAGLPTRPWYKNLYAAPDETSGYASWMLPALRHLVDHRRSDMMRSLEKRYLAVFARIDAELDQIERTLE